MAYTKASLTRIAAEVRAELGLLDSEPFDPHAWSEEYGVPFVSLDEVPISELARQRFMRDRPDLWSAALLQDGTGHLVLFNPAHSSERVRSNLAHEVAHFVAEHALTPAWLDDEGGCGSTAPSQEKEAAELAGALLVPFERAKVHSMRDGDPVALARQFGVSPAMAGWRMRASGGAIITKRARQKSRNR